MIKLSEVGSGLKSVAIWAPTIVGCVVGPFLAPRPGWASPTQDLRTGGTPEVIMEALAADYIGYSSKEDNWKFPPATMVMVGGFVVTQILKYLDG